MIGTSTDFMDMLYIVLSLLAADGLALGAAAGLSKADVELIIFFAIMLHKVCVYKHISIIYIYIYIIHIYCISIMLIALHCVCHQAPAAFGFTSFLIHEVSNGHTECERSSMLRVSHFVCSVLCIYDILPTVSHQQVYHIGPIIKFR